MKAKKISKEQYIKEFCRDRRIRDRRVVYVSEATHKKLKWVAFLFRHEFQTVSSLADVILDRHLTEYKVLHDDLTEQLHQSVLTRFGRKDQREEEYDDEPEDEL